MSFGEVFSGFISGHGNAANLASKGRAALTNGYIARHNAYQQAEQKEYSAKQKNIIAAMNMERLAGNRTAAMDAALAAQGGSGFTSQDSGGTNEREASRLALQQLADLGMSAAVEDSSARFDALLLRQSGEQQLRVAQGEAEYYQRMASLTRRSANVSAVANGALEIGKLVIGNFG